MIVEIRIRLKNGENPPLIRSERAFIQVVHSDDGKFLRIIMSEGARVNEYSFNKDSIESYSIEEKEPWDN